MGKRVIVVGGGIAGMQTALKLSAGGVSALLLERDADLGGKLTGWHKLFPSFTPAHEVLDELRRRLAASDVEVRTRCEVAEVARDGVTLSTGERLEADAVVVATGFTLSMPASRRSTVTASTTTSTRPSTSSGCSTRGVWR